MNSVNLVLVCCIALAWRCAAYECSPDVNAEIIKNPEWNRKPYINTGKKIANTLVYT
jgi:hypothetical protein